MNILEVNNISYKVKDKYLLKDVSFSLEEGGFYCVVGENGSGKTTLLRCLCNDLKTSSGEIKIKDKPLKDYSIKQLSKEKAVVFQSDEIAFDFSAMQIVMMGRMPYQKILSQDSEKDMLIAKECMERTNTWHLKNRNIVDLSGGEKQRVLIARCLCQQTPLILLDEPVSNLDIKHQFEVMELLKSINQDKRVTIFIILHDLSLAMKYSNYTLAMKDGSLKDFGNTKDVLTEKNIESLFGVKAKITDSYNIILEK